MGFLSKYWPTIAGAIAIFFGGFFLWPDNDSRSNEDESTGGLGALPEWESAARDENIPKEETRKKSVLSVDEDTQVVQPKLDALHLDTEIREKLVPTIVTEEGRGNSELSEKDPLVRAVMGEVEVALYEADWCENCRNARNFMDDNSIKFSSRDVESDSSIKEKARRLSGGTAIPVVVIDGKATVGFSVESFQRNFAAAVQQRVDRDH